MWLGWQGPGRGRELGKEDPALTLQGLGKSCGAGVGSRGVGTIPL